MTTFRFNTDRFLVKQLISVAAHSKRPYVAVQHVEESASKATITTFYADLCT